jgi:hypothetical protein
MAKSNIKDQSDFDDLTYAALNVFNPDTGVTVLENELIDTTRWMEIYRIVWSEGENFFSYLYDQPATEYQEGSESEFDPRLIKEVRPVEVKVIQYVEA